MEPASHTTAIAEARSIRLRASIAFERCQGLAWMAVSLLGFTANVLLLRYAGTSRATDPWAALLFRNVVGVAMTLLIFAPQGGRLNWRGLFTQRLLVSRGLLGAAGTAAFYLTIPALGAGLATLLGNTYVIFAPLMAVAMIGERLRYAQLAGVAIAMAGLALLTGIGGTHGHLTMMAVGLGGALAAAATVVVIRQLTRRESSGTIFLAQCVYGVFFSLPLAWPRFGELDLVSAGVLALAATAAAVGQLTMTEGFRHLSVTTGSATQLLLPILTTIGGICLFHEPISLLQILGTSLILGGCWRAVMAGRRQ